MNLRNEWKFLLLVLSISFFLAAADESNAPGRPTNLQATTGNFWVNYTWSAGENTDSFNVSINGTWTNGSKNNSAYTSVGPHGWANISVAGYNATYGLLSDFDYKTKQVDNNPINLRNISGSYDLYEGETLYLDADDIDLDNDTGIFQTNANKGKFNTTTGEFVWKIGAGDRGEYKWLINVSDGYGSSDSFPFTVRVFPNKPGSPTNLQAATGNFWVNYTWNAGANTDSFNVSINGTWTNGSRNGHANTSVGPHGWANISVAGYNTTSQMLSDFETRDTQVPNNPIKLGNISDRYWLNEGDTLYIDAEYNDLDGDVGIFSTNAEGEFNNSTGVLVWKTKGGVYNWQISVTDGYDSVKSYQFKVIIPLHFTIKFIEPTITNDNEQWIESNVGHAGKYIGTEVAFKNTGEESLILIIDEIYNNTRTRIPQIQIAPDQTLSYRKEFEINSSGIKNNLFNYTYEMDVKGFNGKEFTFKIRNLTTISLPIIPINKIKRANADMVFVAEGRTTPPIIYTLEANSSVNLRNISIHDKFYPDKFYNISRLEVTDGMVKCYNGTGSPMSCSTTYSYQATHIDLSRNNCGEPYRSCIINLATFTGLHESNGQPMNDSEYLRIPVVPFIEETSSTDSGRSGGSGSSGGGGGVPPSEDYNNIERREVREMDFLARSAVAYTFKAADPVMVVSFESSVSENGVPVVVEVLRNRSKHIGIDAPHIVYRYFNIFVGTSGFSERVSQGVVAFSVNNSWMEGNGIDPLDIRLFKWEDGWEEKYTEIVESRSSQTYYVGLVGNFSSFAISAITEEKAVVPENTPDISNEMNTNNSHNFSSTPASTNLDMIIWVILIISGIMALYYFRNNIFK